MRFDSIRHSWCMRNRAPRRVAAAVAMIPISACMLSAQQPPAAQPAPSTADPFVRYSTPGQCEQAAIRLHRTYWRDKRQDTVVYAPATDSVPGPVVQAARACAARFTVAGVQERELLDLAQLYTIANQDDLAQAAIDRLLRAQAARPARERGWTLHLMSASLLDARPTRIEAARKYRSQLDALGTPVAIWRLYAYTKLANHLTSLNNRAAAIAAARTALAASKQMDRNDRLDFVSNLVGAYATLAEPLALEQPASATLALFDTVNADLLPLRPAGSPDLEALKGVIATARAPYSLYGSTGPQLRAARWYNTQGDSIRPRRGKVSLLVFAHPSIPNYQMYATVRRLHSKYGSAGLDIVVLASTYGYFRNQPTSSPLTEADRVGHYYVEFLRLPAAVAVEQTRFSNRSTDGRRMNEIVANSQSYSRGGNGVLVDKQGRVRMVGTVVPGKEPLWDAVIAEAVK